MSAWGASHRQRSPMTAAILHQFTGKFGGTNGSGVANVLILRGNF